MKTNLHRGNPYIITAVYYLSFIDLGMATAVLGPTLQGLAANTSSTLAQISSLFLASSFGYLLGSFFVGRIYDRAKGHPIMSFALVSVALFLVVVPLIKTLLFLQALFFLSGIMQGFLDVGANTLIVWLHGDRVPPFMNGLHAFFGVGTTIAPLIVAAVLGNTGSMNTIYWALALLIVPSGLIILFFPSPSHIQPTQQSESRSVIPMLVFLFVLVFFTFTGAELGFGGWIYTYAAGHAYADGAMAARVNAAFWAALTVGRVISIPLAVKLKPRALLWVNFLGVIASLLVVLLFSRVEALLWLGTIGTGLFMAAIFPTILNYAQSMMDLPGSTTSWFFVGSGLGSMTIPWLMGQLIAPFGPSALIITVLTSTILATGIFSILNFKQRKSLA